jgi:ribonuclease P protein subunit POP4
MITSENIVAHEMIGLKTEISGSPNSQIIGLNGTIVDETKSMLILNTKNGFKMIPKKQNTWKFYAENKEIILYGSLLEKRSYDRLEAKI